MEYRFFIPVKANIYLFCNKINDIMSTQNLVEVKEKATKREKINLDWKNNLSIQHLLDAISSILASEYIIIVKQNPEVFRDRGDNQ
ncbi:MAG: hypothetical protein WC532_06295 [Candidatus Omnitrophota bacterium]